MPKSSEPLSRPCTKKNGSPPSPQRLGEAVHPAALPHRHGEEDCNNHILQQLAALEHFQIVADVFRQLGDSTRIRIFWLLCHCEQCVVNISAMVNMTSPAVSHHLRQLKSNGLIVSHRDGKEVYYKAADTEQVRLLHLAIEKIMLINCPK